MPNHLKTLFGLLPRGGIFPRIGNGSTLEKLFTGIGDELDTTEDEVLAILDDLYPNRTGNFLADWERVLGLTNVSVFTDVESRVAAVVAFLTLSPESSITFFEDICAVFGYNITITRSIYKAFQAGTGKAGEQVNTPRLQYVWVVSLAVGPDEALEYIINLFKPAHTYVSFLYASPIYTDDYIARLQGGPVASDYRVNDLVGEIDPFVYTGNNCKAWNGTDYCDSSAALNIGAQDFEIGLEMRLDNLAQSSYRSYFGRWTPDGVDYQGNVSIHQGAGNTVYAIAKSHEGTGVGFGHANTESLGTTLFHTFLIKRVGTVITFYVDGVSRGSVTYPATDTFMVNRALSYRGGPCTKSRAWVDVAGVRVVDYTHAAGPSLVEWDRSGNGNHGTYTPTSGIDTMATTSDLVRPHNILNGFSLYTHATLPPLRVPYDINGDPLSSPPVPTGYTFHSEHPGGVVHNGAESNIIGTADELIGDDLWHDGTDFVERTAAELKANNNDDDRTRVGYDSDGNILDIPIYAVAPTGRALLYLNNYLQTLLD